MRNFFRRPICISRRRLRPRGSSSRDGAADAATDGHGLDTRIGAATCTDRVTAISTKPLAAPQQKPLAAPAPEPAPKTKREVEQVSPSTLPDRDCRIVDPGFFGVLSRQLTVSVQF